MDDETKAKIRKIWSEHKDSKTLQKIFIEDLGEFFDVKNWTPETSKSSEWLLFLGMTGGWNKEERNERIESEVRTLTDEDIMKVQENNRRRSILMLREILSGYEKNPKKFKAVSINEIRQWYKTIQSMEETIKRTHISKGRLKLEAVRTLLPYNQLLKMSPEKIKELKEQVNASFDRILQLRRGERDGQSSPIAG